MPSVVLEKGAAEDFLEALIRDGPVMGPQERAPGQYVFDWLERAEDLVWDYVTTTLPPKKAFFPQRDPLLRFSLGEGSRVEPVVEKDPFVLIGVHPCDLEGLAQLDWAFSQTTVDPHYRARREAATVIGVDCFPDQYCFCESMGTLRPRNGFDLFLTPIAAGYHVEIGTEKGQALLDRHATTRPVEPEDFASAQAWYDQKRAKIQRRLNTPTFNLPLVLHARKDSPIWEETAAKCFSCGSCNLVCPTCFCFDVHDELELNMQNGCRVRTWDACQFVDFAKVAAGHNFRGQRLDRVRHRWNRKFLYLMVRYGRAFCTGCGRCARACMADIGLVEVLNDLVAEQEEAAHA